MKSNCVYLTDSLAVKVYIHQCEQLQYLFLYNYNQYTNLTYFNQDPFPGLPLSHFVEWLLNLPV